jgi:hypothetical protein
MFQLKLGVIIRPIKMSVCVRVCIEKERGRSYSVMY